MINRYNNANQEGLFVVATGLLEEGQIINFVELAALKETVDMLFSDEQSRMLMAELSGDYACDGCMI